MRIAVVDDEQFWREKIVLSIEDISDDRNDIDIFKNGEEYLKSGNEYELIFVDIDMGEKDGFDTINEAREKGQKGRFVILTTHTEFSMKGYRVNAFRYIDKANMQEGMQELFDTLIKIEASDKTVVIPIMKDENIEVKIRDIIYVETKGYHITVHTIEANIDSRMRMADLEILLDDEMIFRCHNSFIVNLNKVKSYDKHFLYLINDDKVEVAKRRYVEFRRRYMKSKFSRANF